jgi:hypothetical protein
MKYGVKVKGGFMTLDEYLKTRKAKRLAKKLGWSDAKTSRLRNHSQWPDVGEVNEIHEATGGKVTFADWLGEWLAKND